MRWLALAALALTACDLDVTPLRQDGGTPCDDGFVHLDGRCIDVNECLVNNGGCDALTVCTNTEGGRTCGGCPEGYRGDGATGCEALPPPDPCEAAGEDLHDGGDGECVPIGTCSPGYRIGLGFSCVPEDDAGAEDASREDASPTDAGVDAAQ